MNMHKVQILPVLLFILISLTLSACQQAAPIPATPTASATLEATATATEMSQVSALATQTPSPSLTPTVGYNGVTEGGVSFYQLTVRIDYDEHHIIIREIIIYTNLTGASLLKLPLIIPPAYLPDVFSLDDLTSYTSHENIGTEFEDAILWVTLPESLEPNSSTEFEITYTLQIPESHSLLGSTDRQLLLTDWFLFIPPYLPETGWLINPPSTVGEYLTYPVAEYYGYLFIQPTTTPLVIAASLPLYYDVNGTPYFKGPGVRNVTFAFSPDYLEYTHEAEGVTIKGYVFPEHAELGQRAADLAADAWALYENLYGDNPREYMAIIEADLNDGMEYDGAFLLSQDYFASANDTPQNYFELLIVHETAHQWFYAQIANDQANEPWLDEALATYSELLYLENTYPDLVDWWWNYRVYAYQPTGWVDSTIYNQVSFRPYVNAVYLRGVQFLDALRQRIGDDAFFAVLRDYATPDGYDTFRSSQDFFDIVASHSQEDITDLLNRYFKNAQP